MLGQSGFYHWKLALCKHCLSFFQHQDPRGCNSSSEPMCRDFCSVSHRPGPVLPSPKSSLPCLNCSFPASCCRWAIPLLASPSLAWPLFSGHICLLLPFLTLISFPCFSGGRVLRGLLLHPSHAADAHTSLFPLCAAALMAPPDEGSAPVVGWQLLGASTWRVSL